MSRVLSLSIAVALSILMGASAIAQSRSSSNDKLTLPDNWVEKVKFRSIGPANMMGRITSIAVYEKDPSTWWAASASGGLIKTTNNGNTFEHQFDDQSTVSIGDVQVSQSDPNIVWVGTGEANPRNSVSWGDGVYKSTDGGKTWTNMGLQKGFQTGRIAIHPTNPDIVYVGVLGRLWGPSEERGLYKTTDGGKNWKRVLFVDDKTGVIDVQMNPKNPETLMVATYERQRDGFDGNDPGKKYGEGSAIYRTTDGGKSFEKMTKGLPSCKLGRVGIQYYRKNPKIVYAIIESEKIARAPANYPYLGIRSEEAEVGLRLTTVSRNSPAAKAELKRGDILLSIGGKPVKSTRDIDDLVIKNYKAGDKVEMVISREREEKKVEVTLAKYPQRRSRRTGRTSSSVRTFVGTLGGQSANHQGKQWHDEGVPEEEYGGVYESKDGGKSWKRINTLNPRPMYYSQFRVDPSDNNYMYVLGTSLYRSKDGGKTFTSDGGRGIHPDNHAMWIDPTDGKHMILGNDGGIYITHDRMDNWDHHNHAALGQFYHVGVGPGRDYYVYGGLQDNGSWGGPVHSRQGGTLNTDWFRVGGGDGFICLVDPNDKDQIYFESQNGAMGSINLRTGRRGFIRPSADRGVRYRFNWKTPFILSPHNSKMHYSAGNYVFRSFDRGNNAKRISPDITNTDRGAGSAISESKVEAGIIYVGTTDGAVWMTRDGGQKWVPLFSTKAGDVAQTAPVEEKKVTETKVETKAKPVDATTAAAIKKAVAGKWTGSFGRGEFTLNLKVDKAGKISGTWESRQGETEISKGTYDVNKKELYLMADTGRFTIEFNVDLDGDSMSGEMDFNEGQFTREFEAERGGKSSDIPVRAISEMEWEMMSMLEKALEDKISGDWDGTFIAEFIPEGRASFKMTLKLAAKTGEITGTYSSAQGTGDIVEGSFDEKTGKITLVGENDEVSLEFKGTLKKGKISGEIDVNGGMIVVEFEATRTGNTKTTQTDDKKETKDAAVAKPDTAKTEKQSDAKASDAKASDAAAQDKPEQSSSSDSSETKVAKKAAPGSLGSLLPGPRWVSSIEASKYRKGRCYISFDGHRSNDDEPYVFVTENYGRTWKSIRGNLPTSAGSVRCVREDVKNQNLLYLGCEFSAWVSVDRGQSWTKLSGGFPTVAVHEIAVHPTAGEIVMGTHGRSLWVADVTVLQQITAAALNRDAHLFKPNSVIRFRRGQERGSSGTRQFVGQNRPSTAGIFYHLNTEAESAKIQILDVRGRVIREETAETEEGLHVFNWDLRRSSRGGAGRGRGGFRGGFGGSSAAGTYLVKLIVDDKEYTETLEILEDPQSVGSGIAAEQSEAYIEFQKALMGLSEEEGQEGDDKDSDK